MRKKQSFNPEYWQEKMMEALYKKHEKHLVEKVAEEIKIFFVSEEATSLYYETGRMFYYRYPVFLIRLFMLYKHRRVLPKSIPKSMVKTIVERQMLQATKLLFRVEKPHHFF